MAPAFAQFEQKYKSKIKIVEVNVDDNAAMSQYGKLKQSDGIPETVVLRDGKVMQVKLGAMTEQDLADAVTQASK